MVGSLSGIRTQSGVVATKGTRRWAGTLVKPTCLRGNAGRVSSFRLYPGIRLTTEEKSRKNVSQGSRKVPAEHDLFYQSGCRDCRDRL